MADAQKTIDLIFNGVDKTGAATLSALKNAESFTKSIKDVTQPIADFTVGALKVEAGLLAAGVAMTVFAAHTAGSFEQSFSQISTLFDASDADLAKFKDHVKEYASTSGKSIEDIMASLQAAIGSGISYTDSLGLMTVAERLAIATRADMKGTTEVLVSTMNAYGIATKDAGGLADLMFQIIKDGKIEMNDLAHSLSMVTPLAATAGVSMQEVGAAVAVLTASGIAPSMAIEYLRSAITNIIKPSEQATKMAASLGIEFDANALKSKGLAVVLDDVAKATGGNSGQMAKLIGDVGGLVAAMVLTGPQADKFKETLVSMGNSAGSVSAAYEKMANSMEVVKQRVVNAFTGMMTAIGTPLLDEFGGLANAIAKIFQALGASVKDGGLKDLVAYVESVFGDIQKTLETVATNLPAALAKADLSGFKGGIDAVVGAFKLLFNNIDIRTVDGLTRAIELAGAAFLGLSSFTAGVIESFKPLFDKLVEIGGKVGGLGPDFFKMAGEIGGVLTQFNLLATGLGGLLPRLEMLVGLMVAQQGLSLVGGAKTLLGILPGLTAAIGAAGLAGALTTAGVVLMTYFASERVVALVLALGEWKKANEHLQKSQEESTAINTRAGLSLEQFAKTTGIAAKSVDEASKLVDSGAVVWSTAVNGWVKAGDALADVGGAAKGTLSPLEKANQAMLDAFTASEKAAGGTGKLAGAHKEVSTYALKVVPIFDALTGAITGYEHQLVKSETGTIKLASATGKAGANLTKIAEETKKAEDAQKKWNEEVAKMKFQEKLALIEQQTKLMTAQIEADAKKTVAAFESISSSISESYKLLGSLFGLMKDYDSMSWKAQGAIDKQIDLENKRLDEQFKLQKALIEAQTANMKAQTNALLKGDGLIKIDGAGLKPHLEAFMWEILQAIQVKVNADGLKMLLGA